MAFRGDVEVWVNVGLEGGAERDVGGLDDTSGESAVGLDCWVAGGVVSTMNVSTSLEQIIFSREA